MIDRVLEIGKYCKYYTRKIKVEKLS